MYDITAVGRQIKAHRHRLELTQSELADKLKVSYQAVSSWEKSVTVPDIENLCKLAVVFNVSLDALLQSDENNVMIAVDGGGTKAEFVMFTAQGNILTRFKLPGTNASLSGFEQVVEILCRGIDMCINQRLDVGTVYIGTAGSKLPQIQQRLSERYSRLKITVESDGVNALYSDEGDVALICGTGSILILKDGDGIRKVGGWGYRLSDPGSAYNFGREALLACADHEDGVQNNAVLHEKICKKLDVSAIRGAGYPKDAPFIASLAPVVFEAYKEGDKLAQEILHRQMKALSRQINAACRPGMRLILCGGMFEHNGDILIPILKNYVVSGVEFVVPTLPPVYGACVRCCSLSHIECGEEFKSNFTRDYSEQ